MMSYVAPRVQFRSSTLLRTPCHFIDEFSNLVCSVQEVQLTDSCHLRDEFRSSLRSIQEVKTLPAISMMNSVQE
jgi:hypothetical protein